MQTRTVDHKGITLSQNPLTGDWFVPVPEGTYQPYICETLTEAKGLVNRYRNAGAK